MWKLKRKWPVVAAITLGAAAAITANILTKKPALEFADILPSLEDALIIAGDKPAAIINGQLEQGKSAPFIYNGEMYASLDEAVSSLGASMGMDGATGIVSVESNSCLTQFIPEYNVLVFNNEPIVMRSSPVKEDGQIFLSVDIIAKILNVSCFRDYDNELAVLRGDKPLTGADFAAIASEMGLAQGKKKNNKALDKLGNMGKPGNKYGDTYDLYAIAREGRLYASNSEGQLYKWLLLDDFTISEELQNVTGDYIAGTIFIAGEGANKKNLYMIGETEIYSNTPDEVQKNDIVYAMWKYIVEKADGSENSGGGGGGAPADDAQVYKAAIGGEYSKNFIDLKQADIDNGIYEKIVSTAAKPSESDMGAEWNRIIDSARKGDILLLRNSLSDSRYGFFNHCALIIDVMRDTREIRVLQARSPEKGVGADLPVDFVSAESFYSDSFWRNYNIIVLGRMAGLNEDRAENMVQGAYEKYNGYSFGYGGFFGAKQATCAEIIVNTLATEKLNPISDSEYRHKLKEFVNGNAISMIILPDDIALSDNIELITIIER